MNDTVTKHMSLIIQWKLPWRSFMLSLKTPHFYFAWKSYNIWSEQRLEQTKKVMSGTIKFIAKSLTKWPECCWWYRKLYEWWNFSRAQHGVHYNPSLTRVYNWQLFMWENYRLPTEEKLAKPKEFGKNIKGNFETYRKPTVLSLKKRWEEIVKTSVTLNLTAFTCEVAFSRE